MTFPLLQVEDLKVHFPVQQLPWQSPSSVKAVDGVSFNLNPGETLGIVGESGCGKSTLARAVLRLIEPTSGHVRWQGDDLLALDKREMAKMRRQMQLVFQDPLASLNPRMTIGDIIAEPLRTHHPKLGRQVIKNKVKAIMDKVGLLPSVINRYPHEFSGGQCQRVGIARALILEPKLLVCDEPVSALDVSIQAQVINLLKDLQSEMGLALLFIAHDLGVVRHISDRVMVMYLGHAVETGTTQALFESPEHPYTQALLSAVPIPNPELELNKKVQLLPGELPSPLNPPVGCVFHTRCPKATEICAQNRPPVRGAHDHHNRCHHSQQEEYCR